MIFVIKKKLYEIINKINPQTIIHLAGQSTIDMVERKKSLYLKNNFIATKNLIDIIQELKVPNLIFSSTAAIYKKKIKLNESSELFSKNSYGLSKIKCENEIKKLNPKISKYCILRFFNVVSSLKKNKIGEFHNPETHLIPIVINSIFNKKKIFIYGKNYKTKDGTCNRDYIHILDILNAIELSIKYLSKKKNKSNIFNLGSGKCLSVLQIIKACFKFTNLKTKIKYIKNRKFDVAHLLCDIKKAKKILKWRPKHSNLKKIIFDEIWWYKFLYKRKIKRQFIY